MRAKQENENLNVCPTCGAGHVHPVPSVDLGLPKDSTYIDYRGKEQLCDCAMQDELRRRYLLANIPKAYWRLGEDDYYGDPEAWDIAQDYLENWDQYKTGGLGLEFHSSRQGTGKTFLLTYVSRKLIWRGERVHYHPFRKIMGIYQIPYAERKPLQDKLEHSTVLALDEVGKANTGAQEDFFATEFENLMRDRIDSNKVTLMTTNLLPDILDQHYPRTYSLLAAKQKRWAIGGEDRRRSGEVFNIVEQMVQNKLKRPIQ
jgi:DNA replication protein DnaC